MNNEMKSFEFHGRQLRAGVLPNGDTYVVAADVCEFAGNGNTSQSLARLDDDEKGLLPIISNDRNGINKSLLYVTESGFYHLCLTFRLRKGSPHYEVLKQFRRWVTHDVLPSIRKTGSYSGDGVSREHMDKQVDVINQNFRVLRDVVDRNTEDVSRAIGDMQLTVERLLKRVAELEGAIRSRPSDDGPTGYTEVYMRLKDYCREFGMKDRFGEEFTMDAIRGYSKTVGCISRDYGVHVKRIEGAAAYRVDILNIWKARHEREYGAYTADDVRRARSNLYGGEL